MKKLLSVLILLSLVFSLCSSFSLPVSAAMLPADAMDGYENLLLAYTHNPTRDDYGRHTPEDLKPYVAYLDENGKALDFFFDSYLFLPCMSNGVSGARMHYDNKNPTRAIDWTNYVEDTFYEGTNVDALEVAFGEAKAELNEPNKKAGVVLTILYPGVDKGSTFGSLGGKELDLTKQDDRKYAIKWIIDEQLKLFNEREYENLDLIGFYWLEEYLYTGVQGDSDAELFRYASEYLHSKGLKFVWIPWYRANGYKEWKSLGVDAITMQPNMYWQGTASLERVPNCLSDCEKYGMGMEIEVDYNAIRSGDHFNRYLDYLEGGMNSGAMNSVKMYYQDAKQGVYYGACYSKDERARKVYDLTYKYAKGTLTQEDIDSSRSEIFSLDTDVEWVSKGKPYTASAPYSDGGTIDYQKNDGTELTDGVIGATELGTEWHAFHKSLLDSDGRMSVTVDLGEIRSDLTHFMIHFSHIGLYGIGDPADDVKIYISNDGTNFELLAEPKLNFIDVTSYIKYVCKPVSARYVKFSFINSTANFVFCSEALVGVGDASHITDASSDEQSEETDESLPNETEAASEDIGGNSEPEREEDNGNAVLIVVIAICVIIVAAAIIAVIKKKKTTK